MQAAWMRITYGEAQHRDCQHLSIAAPLAHVFFFGCVQGFSAAHPKGWSYRMSSGSGPVLLKRITMRSTQKAHRSVKSLWSTTE